MSDYLFAGVISNWWYIINAIFWSSFLVLGKKNGIKKKIVLLELLVFAFMVLVYYTSMPLYLYETAVRTIQSEQVSVHHKKAETPWKYRGFTDGNVYLVVFEGEKPKAFWFDPYSGNYGPYDIENKLPFLFGED